jgi:hypothetical protein
MDLHQVGYWLFCLSLFFAPLLVRAPFVRRFLDDTLTRLGGPEDVPSGDEFDHFPERWSAIVRRDRLLADVQRLQRILAGDAGMSAVRQIGNRLAYEQLLHELRETPDLPAAAPAVRAVDRWEVPARSLPVGGVSGTGDWRPLRNVETLEIGWRR